MGRDYRQEYDRYQGKPEQKKRRAGRNAARRNALSTGAVSKGDGKDIHHRDGNPKNNSSSNTQVMSASSNRSFRRNRKAGKA
tara:strand:- start:1957 stop:2202 length:246 start_codon:yes stop_codon:yes gene_type:complete